MRLYRPAPAMAALLAIAFVATPAAAQHDHSASPYAGNHSSEIPSLTPREIEELRTGAGMGLARAAELNGYPGPLHVLELAEALELTDEQREQVEEIRSRMLESAVALGEQVLEAERHLGMMFRMGHATGEIIEERTGELGVLQGRLRAVHLRAHVETHALLTPGQIEAYDAARGYAG